MPPDEPDDAAKASATPPAGTAKSNQADAPPARRPRRKPGQPLTVVGHINWVDADSPGGKALMRAQGRALRNVLIAVAERRQASGAADTAPATSSQEHDEPSNQ